MGQFFKPRSRIRPKTDTPFLEMGQFFILRSRVQQEYNGLLLNALNRTLKAICPWKPRLKWIPRSKPGASKSRPLWAAHTPGTSTN